MTTEEINEEDSYEYRKAQADRKKEQEANDCIRALSNYVNHYSDFQPLVQAMACEHRTLQQMMTGFMLKWFIHLSELHENWYDLRNEASVKIAKQIVNNVEEVKWGLPLI